MSHHIPVKFLDAAASAIASARARHPTLDRNGWIGDGTDLDLASVATAIAFVLCGPVRRLAKPSGKGETSYTWKHHAERWGERSASSPTSPTAT